MLRRKLGGMSLPRLLTRQRGGKGRFEKWFRQQSKQNLFYQPHNVKQKPHLPWQIPLCIHFRMVMMEFWTIHFLLVCRAQRRTKPPFGWHSELNDPEIGPNLWSWLPTQMQVQYSKKSLVEKKMNPGSFSVMAYGKAPRWLAELGRLKRLGKASFERRQLKMNGRLGKSYRSLDVMSAAVLRYAIFQIRWRNRQVLVIWIYQNMEVALSGQSIQQQLFQTPS